MQLNAEEADVGTRLEEFCICIDMSIVYRVEGDRCAQACRLSDAVPGSRGCEGFKRRCVELGQVT